MHLYAFARVNILVSLSTCLKSKGACIHQRLKKEFSNTCKSFMFLTLEKLNTADLWGVVKI